MWGRVLDVINHAKLIGSRVLELQVAENLHLPLTGGIALTTIVRTNVLHCDVTLKHPSMISINQARVLSVSVNFSCDSKITD